jgi:hypothetical protein
MATAEQHGIAPSDANGTRRRRRLSGQHAGVIAIAEKAADILLLAARQDVDMRAW